MPPRVGPDGAPLGTSADDGGLGVSPTTQAIAVLPEPPGRGADPGLSLCDSDSNAVCSTGEWQRTSIILLLCVPQSLLSLLSLSFIYLHPDNHSTE